MLAPRDSLLKFNLPSHQLWHISPSLSRFSRLQSFDSCCIKCINFAPESTLRGLAFPHKRKKKRHDSRMLCTLSSRGEKHFWRETNICNINFSSRGEISKWQHDIHIAPLGFSGSYYIYQCVTKHVTGTVWKRVFTTSTHTCTESSFQRFLLKSHQCQLSPLQIVQL